MGHPRWANSALCHHQSRHATCGRNQPEHGETRASPAWQHSTSREMGWTGLAGCRSCHQPGLPGERQAGDSQLMGRCPSQAGRAELAWSWLSPASRCCWVMLSVSFPIQELRKCVMIPTSINGALLVVNLFLFLFFPFLLVRVLKHKRQDFFFFFLFGLGCLLILIYSTVSFTVFLASRLKARKCCEIF